MIRKLKVTQGSRVWAQYFAAYDALAEDGADRKFLISVALNNQALNTCVHFRKSVCSGLYTTL